MLPSTSTQFEVAGAEAGLEDKQILVDLWRRRGKNGEGISSLGGLGVGRPLRSRSSRDGPLCVRGRCTFDDLIELGLRHNGVTRRAITSSVVRWDPQALRRS